MTEPNKHSGRDIDFIQNGRLLSNYFFLSVNFICLFFDNTVLLFFIRDLSQQKFQLHRFEYVAWGSILVPVSLLAAFICFYWLQEQREYLIKHEVRFRALMEEERQYSDKGLLSKEWDQLGDYPFRRSPVFFVRSAVILPVLFMCAQIVPGYIFLSAILALR